MKWCVINNDGTLYYGDDAAVRSVSKLRRAYFRDFMWFNVAKFSVSKELSKIYGESKDEKVARYREFYEGYDDRFHLNLMCGTYPFLKECTNRPWLINKFLTYFYDSLTVASQIVLLYSYDDGCSVDEFKKGVGEFVDGIRHCYADANGLPIGKDAGDASNLDATVGEILVYGNGDNVVRISGEDNIEAFANAYMMSDSDSSIPPVSGEGVMNGRKVTAVRSLGAVYLFDDDRMSVYFGTDTSWRS